MIIGNECDLVVNALCAMALADHLGDVRDAERHLWKLLGVKPTRIVTEYDSAWRNTKATLERNGFPIPGHLTEE